MHGVGRVNYDWSNTGCGNYLIIFKIMFYIRKHFLVMKHCVSTTNHMFKREIRDKFQKMNDVHFPKISRINM